MLATVSFMNRFGQLFHSQQSNQVLQLINTERTNKKYALMQLINIVKNLKFNLDDDKNSFL